MMSRNQILSGLAALAAVGVTLWLLGNQFVTRSKNTEPSDAEIASAQSVATSPTVVHLSDSKLRVSDIRTAAVVRKTLIVTHSVPARFTYDDTRHVAIRVATDGILESVSVRPGDTVTKDQVLAVLRSPAVGVARSEVLAAISNYEIAKLESDRLTAIHRSVEKLVGAIQAGDTVDAIEQKFQSEQLGSYRDTLLTGLSNLRLATTVSRSASGLESSGAISGRVVQERESKKDQATASLRASIEQASFDTEQSKQKAVAKTENAYREVLLAQQTLSTLLGPTSPTDLDRDRTSELSRVQICSPRDGTIERKVFSEAERVTTGDELFIVADTSQLWIKADIRERDWNAMSMQAGDEVLVTTNAAGPMELTAKVYFVGREVEPSSGAIPLVLAVANPAGLYRPGLFARVNVPINTVEDVLVVPESAIIDLNGDASVFVPQGDGFRPTQVEIGQKSNAQVEVLSGLSEGEQVVVSGAFVLKSELLLEGGE
jgi:RND family efflux transporter MFP subunit